MQQIGISEIQRNLHKLDNFDIVEVIDKKRDKVKGYFVDKKYAHAIQELIKQQRAIENKSTQLAGSLSAYADSNRFADENSAWKKHIIEKHVIDKYS